MWKLTLLCSWTWSFGVHSRSGLHSSSSLELMICLSGMGNVFFFYFGFFFFKQKPSCLNREVTPRRKQSASSSRFGSSVLCNCVHPSNRTSDNPAPKDLHIQQRWGQQNGYVVWGGGSIWCLSYLIAHFSKFDYKLLEGRDLLHLVTLDSSSAMKQFPGEMLIYWRIDRWLKNNNS